MEHAAMIFFHVVDGQVHDNWVCKVGKNYKHIVENIIR